MFHLENEKSRSPYSNFVTKWSSFFVVHHQTSQSMRRTVKIMRQKQCREVSKPHEGKGQSQSVDETARPIPSQRSTHVSHDRPTTSRSLRRCEKP
ncbi:hypothetical protein AB205_0083200 [Aquarana catesbeiana]|uniref:Uncharacterized protein n=1 Tax=Aquarana catesbeiana TaxID=8400 RepID=A0A2G9RIF5_AQUCT|nr:hypothetical protein AB205_0083200 [Aquarana catesbeiana]